jgi:hypothetical protein
LDDDLRKIITSKPADQLPALLTALQQHGQIVSAGLYRVVGSKLKRIAVAEPTAVLGESLVLDEVPLAARALDQRSIASVKDPMGTSATQPYLAAVPFGDAQGAGVLLIQDMPFAAFNWPHLARIDLILHWTFALLRYRDALSGEGKGTRRVPIEEFKVLLAQALQAESSHSLPSIVVRVDFTQPNEAKDSKLEQRLLATLPATALVTRLPQQGSLIALLPFGGEMEAESASHELSNIAATLQVSHYLVVGPTTVEALWAHVVGGEVMSDER